MTSSRDTVFASIRRSLGVTGTERPRHDVVTERMARHPRGLIPARGQLPPADQLALFVTMVEASAASVEVLDRPDQVPEAVASYLRGQNLPSRLRMGADPRLNDLPWGTTSIDVSKGPSDGQDLVGLSHATAGVAETGTLVLTSGADNPTTINFLPDYHVVVVKAADVASDYETVWDRIRKSYGEGLMPRTVNWVTGPSRSGDIEQTLLFGAHGPRKVHVIVVK
ncbi:MAG: lactate utilization protein [Alphaproteobacteria bacterium]